MSGMPAASGGFADIEGLAPPGAGGPVDALEPIGGHVGGVDPGSYPDHLIRGPSFEPFYEGMDFDILRGLTTEDRVRVQQQLVAVGLASKVLYGEIDDPTLRGFRSVLAMSNRAGEDWKVTLGRIATNPGLQEEAKEFEPRPFLKPDYATLAQDVKATFRQRLGRDPDDYELQQLTGELTGYYALENEAANEFASIQHEQSTTPGIQPGGTVGNVDPMARFAQLFDEKYKGEMAFNDDKDDAKVSRAVTEGATSTLDGMINRSR